MSNPQPGDFFVTATSGNLLDKFFAWCIRFGTESTVNHAGIYIGNGQIVEAVRSVVRGTESEYPNAVWSNGMAPKYLYIVPKWNYSVTLTEDQRQAIVSAAQSYVGRPYGYLDILAIGLAQKRFGSSVSRVSKWWWVKRIEKSKALICSQLVVEAYRAAGVDLAPGVPAGLVSPGDLLRRIEE